MDSDEQDPDINIQIAKTFEDIDIDLPKIEKLVAAICRRFETGKVTVSIAIVGDEKITQINARFLNHDFATDCISFNLSEEGADKSFDIAVNAQMAAREAKLRKHSSEAELALYITHGLLHNLGFDDAQLQHAKTMHETEDEILQQQGFGLVYNETSES